MVTPRGRLRFFRNADAGRHAIVEAGLCGPGQSLIHDISCTIQLHVNSCCGIISSGSKEKLYLYAMTGALILLDNLHPKGVFHKKSPVMIKNCMQILSTNTSLLITMRFSCQHLFDPGTLPAIRTLFESE